ncbi:hypothetical protein EDB83DRAFT_2530341 [Lactarius deliciosus]|nr:hypothetical protein EDB83DRAFT_2530341 [Lactarius deliciosus]
MQELRRRIRQAKSTTAETWPQSEENCPPIPPGKLDPDPTEGEQSSRLERPPHTVDPVRAAEQYCKIRRPLTDGERDDVLHNEEEVSNGRGEAMTTSKDTIDQTTGTEDSNGGCPTEKRLASGEDDPIAAINTLTDKEREELREILSESNVPLTKADLWGILEQIKDRQHHDSPEVREEETNPTVTTNLVHTPRSVQLPRARTDKTLAPGDTLDDEELWDTFTRDDQEEALSRLLGDDDDDDDDDNPPRGDSTRYGFTYGPGELGNSDNEGDTLSDTYNVLTDRTCKLGYLEDEDDKSFDNQKDSNYEHPDRGRLAPGDPGENNPIAVIDMLTAEEREELQETLSEATPR